MIARADGTSPTSADEGDAALDRAMRESNLIRWLVARATDLELSRPPRLTDAERTGGPELDAAWGDVDDAMKKGGYL